LGKGGLRVLLHFTDTLFVLNFVNDLLYEMGRLTSTKNILVVTPLYKGNRPQLLWEACQAISVVTMFASRQESRMFSWFPFKNKTNIKFAYQDTCYFGKFKTNVDLYPSKIPVQLDGFPLYVRQTFDDNFDASILSYYNIGGPQNTLTRLIASKLNATLVEPNNTFSSFFIL